MDLIEGTKKPLPRSKKLKVRLGPKKNRLWAFPLSDEEGSQSLCFYQVFWCSLIVFEALATSCFCGQSTIAGICVSKRLT